MITFHPIWLIFLLPICKQSEERCWMIGDFTNVRNSGAHAPSYLYRIVADHYKTEDINFHKPELQF